MKSVGFALKLLAFAGFAIGLSTGVSRATRPYRPTHPDPVLESWRWRSFPELKGLGLRCMTEDSRGSIWFGVDDGVRVYNGSEWAVHSEEAGLSGGTVSALCTTGDGAVYAGTPLGVFRHDNGRWVRVFPEANNFPWPVHDLLEASDGSLWAATEWGALHLSDARTVLYTTKTVGEALSTLVPGLKVSHVPVRIASERLWAGGVGAGTLGDLIWTVAPRDPAETAGLQPGDRIRSVGGRLWTSWRQLIGPPGTSVDLTIDRPGTPDPLDFTLSRTQMAGGYLEFPVYDVYEDRDGVFWFGLMDGEVIRVDPEPALRGESQAWQRYTEEDGLAIGHSPRIVQTRDGTIWTVSGHGLRGVNRLAGQAWETVELRTLGGDDHNYSVLETEDGILWVGGNKGYLHSFHEGEWRVYHPPQVPLAEAYVSGLMRAGDGALWIAGQGQEAVRLDYVTSRWESYKGILYQCEDLDGATWFLSDDDGVVRRSAAGWDRFDEGDGLIDTPVSLAVTREGDIWTAGSHNGVAATARFDGTTWKHFAHPDLSWGIDHRSTFQASDGTIWFGAANPIRERGHFGGVIQFTGDRWTHHRPPDALYTVYGIGETQDGTVWFGGGALYRFGGPTQDSPPVPTELASAYSEVLYTTPSGELWVGHRRYGVFRHKAGTWTHFDVKDGLSDNRVESILESTDGSVWVSTAKGVSRFDGSTWTTSVLPGGLGSGRLLQSGDGALWVNRAPSSWYSRAMPGFSMHNGGVGLRSVRYEPDSRAPETAITLSLREVSQPGNTTLAWEGVDPWKSTPDAALQFSWRLVGGGWSPYSLEKTHIFQALAPGDYAFEVRSRDRDFNEDPTPAMLAFTVVPPVWREPWFIGMTAVFVAIICLQAGRILVSNRRLKDVNRALSAANEGMAETNEALNRERDNLQRSLIELEHTQAQLVQSEKVAALGKLVAGVLHEMNTPIGIINSGTSVSARCVRTIVETMQSGRTLEEISGDRGFQRALEALATNVEVTSEANARLNRITTSLKNFARLDEAVFQKVDIHEGLESTLTLVETETADRIEITREYGDLPEVGCYPAEMNQVFLNLISNAIQAIEAEGKITIRTFVADERIHIQISDSGKGIPQSDLGDLFEPKFSREGSRVKTGLGLFTSSNIIQKHDGEIRVDSREGKGSTLTVEIPANLDGAGGP